MRGPKRLTDGTEPAYHAWDTGEGDADDPVDRAIAATRAPCSPITDSTTSIRDEFTNAPSGTTAFPPIPHPH